MSGGLSGGRATPKNLTASVDSGSDGADGEPLTFTAAEVLERVDELGDLFAPTLTVEQDLPAPSPSG